MAKPEFVAMARAALNFTKKKSTWEVFLRGYASTNQRGSANERDILEGLWKNYPTPEALRAACPMDEVPRWDRDNPSVGSGLQNLRSRTGAARDLCKIPDYWNELSYLLRCPNEESQARVKDFSLKPEQGNANKSISKMKIGLATKGADMTMLWGGCEVPVIDLWMLRYLTPQVKELNGQSWEQIIKGYIKEMRHKGEDLEIKSQPDTPKELIGTIVPAAELDENNKVHRIAASGYVQTFIQRTKTAYGWYRDEAYRQAEREGLPVNVWHVATWIELKESKKYDKDGNEIHIESDDYDVWLNYPGDTDVKADKQTVRKARDFLNELRLPLPEPYDPASHVDMSMISFNVPDEFHDEIEGGDPRKTPRKPNTWDERINFDIGGIEIYLDYDTYSKEFELDISRQFGEPSVQDFRRVRELVYALLRENPGSAFQIRAMGEQRRKVYERVGFEVIKASQLRSGVMFQMRLAGVPSAYGGEEPDSPEWFKEQISLVMRGQTGQTLSTEAALDMLRQMRSEVTGLLRFKPGVGEDVEQYPTIKATAERRSWEFVVELIDQHIESLERFDEPGHHFDPDREPTEAQKRYYQRGPYPHESWLRGAPKPEQEQEQEQEQEEEREEPNHSFMDLSGLSRYAADIEALVS